MNLSTVVRRANVVYDRDSFESGIPLVPQYVSSGILGGCFDHFGFMERPNSGTPEGRTVLGCSGQYHRAAHGRHIQFPLAVISARLASDAALNLLDCTSYRQELDIYDGVLRTSYDMYGRTDIECFASQRAPNMLCMHIIRSNESIENDLVLAVECETSVCQNNDTQFRVEPVEVTVDSGIDEVRITSRTNTTQTRWVVQCPGAAFVVNGSRITVRLAAGEYDFRVWVEYPACPGPEILAIPYEQTRDDHVAAWHACWKSSWLDIPEVRAHAIWCRMKYYAVSTFPPVPDRPPCPSGLMSNIWGFTFPQDVYYIEETLARLGHVDRIDRHMEWWLEQLAPVREYSRRLLGVEGAYYPWTPPFKDLQGYELDGVTGADSYELHNPVYVAAMVWHRYLAQPDIAWLRRYFPILQEVFRFYAGISTRSSDGTFDSFHEKARGQDEASSVDGRLKNLLCAGYSAEYAARVFVEAAGVAGGADENLLVRAREMVSAGMTRAPLLRPEGFYRTFLGDDRPVGRQKHPVQLNPITYLPMPDMVERDPAIECAWRNRYALTIDARKPLTLGWTLGQFALASARMRSPAEFEKDLRSIQPCHGADPRWIQFYESSFWEGWHRSKAFYFPMMALYLQAFTDCVVQDWRGYIDLFACVVPGWNGKRVAFEGVRARGGVVVSGTLFRRGFRVTLKPDRNVASVNVRVSLADARVDVTGCAEERKTFAGGETVTVTFRGKRSIRLSGTYSL